MQNDNINLPTGPGGSSSGPQDGSYHETHAMTRRLRAASAGRPPAASSLPVPPFYPVEWPSGILTYFAVLAIYSATILGLLASRSGSLWMAVAAPAAISLTELGLVPWLLKYSSLLSRQIAGMRGFIAEDRQARESFSHVARVWGGRDWLAFGVLLGCFFGKALILLTFGAFQPMALLAINWVIATVELAKGCDALTTTAPCFLISCVADSWHLHKRLRAGAKLAGSDGLSKLGVLPFRQYPFITAVMLCVGRTGGHELVFVKQDGLGFHYILFAAGTLDDVDRASFLNCQPNQIAQLALARALGAVQLEQLNADPTRPLLAGTLNRNSITPIEDAAKTRSDETNGDAKAA